VIRVDVLLMVVLRYEVLAHFVGAYAVEFVQIARCLLMSTFKSKRTYGLRAKASSNPCAPSEVSE